jgi:hypothetical protein
MRRVLRVIGIVCGIAGCALADAQPRDLVVNHRVCELDREARRPVADLVRSVPIGCDFVDERLGCPARARLSVTFNFEAPRDATATVTIANAPTGLRYEPEGREATTLRGPAAEIVLKPGRATLSGFDADPERVPIASVSFKVKPQPVSRTPNPWLKGPASASLVRLELIQLVGNYVVRETSINHYYYPCNETTSMEAPVKDQIVLQDAGASSQAVVLIDAKTSAACTGCDACLDYDDHKGVDDFEFANLLPKDTCRERVAVYSNQRALHFVKDSTFWKVGHDVRKLGMVVLAEQPLRIWVLYDHCVVAGTCTQAQSDEEKRRPERFLQNAMRIYKEQYAGIGFKRTTGDTDWSNPPEPSTMRSVVYTNDAIQCDDTALDHLQAFTALDDEQYAKQLNIFLIQDPGGHGVWCGADVPDEIGRNTILLGDTAEAGTLAHELGHALLNSGKHADPNVDGFTAAHADNLMRKEAWGEQLTLGQLFRASLNPESSLNRHGARRTLPTADCLPSSGVLDSCPALILDVTPR